MAEFSGKVVDAQFVDAERSIIKVLYEQDELIMVYNLDVNPDHPDYKELMSEGWDLEKIVESTAEYKRAESAAFNIEVNQAAKMLVDEILASEKEILANEKQVLDNTKKDLADLSRSTRMNVQDMLAEVWTHIFDSNTDKDMIFKFKLWVLEQDFVKEISKEQKSAIRKATRVTQLFSIIDDLIK